MVGWYELRTFQCFVLPTTFDDHIRQHRGFALHLSAVASAARSFPSNPKSSYAVVRGGVVGDWGWDAGSGTSLFSATLGAGWSHTHWNRGFRCAVVTHKIFHTPYAVLRGGDWYGDAPYGVVASRLSWHPAQLHVAISFRCAVVPFFFTLD